MGYAIPIQRQEQYVTIECFKCGVIFAVSKELNQNWRRDRTQFFCPNGHSQSYIESEADRLKKQLEDAKRDAEWQRNRAASLDAQLTKERRAATRLKKRVSCGICPHCKRTVKQMADHIKSKHPEVLTTT